MTKHIIAVLALLASFAANATICNPTCTQPTNNLKDGETLVNLRLSNAPNQNDTVMTKLRIKDSSYSNKVVPIGLYQVEIDKQVVDAFCVDPFQPAISTNSKYIASKLDANDFISSNRAARFELAQRLYDNFYADLEKDSNYVKAGFNVALWEIFYDDQNTSKGDIKGIKGSSADVLKEANWFLSALTKPEWKITNKYDLTFYKSVCNQDFLVAKLNPPSQIPVPAALPLFISGLVGFGLMRRRKSA